MSDVMDKSLEDRMESFFLSETIKYLYLTFDKENYLNNKGEHEFVFTTEGHFYPIKSAFKIKHQNNKFKMKKGKNQFSRSKTSSNTKKCNLNKPLDDYYKIRFNLPMKIKYFEQLFEMIGVEDNLDKLLDRKVK
jgi:ER degradation enhancer, mannosidase alpha-like 1